MRTIIILFAVCLLSLACGCDNANRKPPAEELQTLRRQTAQLTGEVQRLTAENTQLQKRLQTLARVPDDVRLEELYRVKSLKISRYTNLYDKDRDGKKEKLIIYFQPMDEDGDVIKSPGAVDVQLWDLNRDENQALLGQWRVDANQLRKLWFSTIVTINYRLTFDIADKVQNFDEPLTVKVTFTDYLTGKVFKEQRVIKPQ